MKVYHLGKIRDSPWNFEFVSTFMHEYEDFRPNKYAISEKFMKNEVIYGADVI